MLFTEPVFLFVFLPLMLAACAWGGLGSRNTVLAIGSLLFYAWDQFAHVYVLLASITFNYVVGRGVGPGRSGRLRKVAIVAGVIGNLSILGYYKYSGFVVESVLGIAAFDAPVNMPLGISFFTFQAMSYVIDVYRGDAAPQRNFINLSLYISLFPQLIAGPIVRYRELVEQLCERTFTARGFSIGVRQFIFGLGKKLLVADTLAVPVRIVFDAPVEELSSAMAWIGLVCFTLQIYFDFSGYSDMAMGLGRMFGFQIPLNFHYPYAARSVTEFWHRWHITLSRWFRDCLYIPLGGNRGSQAKTYRNLLVVFLLCGFWHGASWSFIFWGLLHGFFLVSERAGLRRLLERAGPAVPRVYLLAAVMLGWVFFRCDDFGHAIRFLQPLLGSPLGGQSLLHVRDLLTNSVIITLAFAVIAAAPVYPWLRRGLARRLRQIASRPLRRRRLAQIDFVGNLVLLAILVLSVITMSAQTYTPFLYFRF